MTTNEKAAAEPGITGTMPGLGVFQAIQDGIQIWSLEGQLWAANDATFRLFGVPPQVAPLRAGELFSRCADEHGHPVSIDSAWIGEVVARGSDGMLLCVHLDGRSLRWLRFSCYRQLPDGPDAFAGHIVSLCVDVSRFIEQEAILQRQAQYDPLTGLPNRILFADRLHQALARAHRRTEPMAVCMLDLDGFKPINDRLGHKAGDQMLQEIAYRLKAALREEDTAARLGGDEFGLLVGGLAGFEDCERVLNRVLHDIALPMSIDGHVVNVTGSIGVALYPGDVMDPDLLLRHADQAMYQAKEAGKGCFHLFDPAVAGKLRASRNLLKKIQGALEAGEFKLNYQPKVDCRLGRIVGLEALVRWQHPVLGLRHPGEFLPLIEKEDAIIALGEWVIGEALNQMAAWRTQGIEVSVSVNISARQFLQANFAPRLTALLDAHDPELVRHLEFEILETAVLEDINAVSRLIHHYHKDGIRFDLDDFGTGYSSLIHLKRLAADALKIDQTFVRDMLNDPGDLTIVQGVISLARAFKLDVVAEGVEDIEQLLTLMELGCDVMQGYVIARPMPAEQVPIWVRQFVADPRWRMGEAAFPNRSDFELLLVKVTHRHWYQQVLKAVHDGEGEVAWPELDEHRCRLGTWLEGARAQLGAEPQYSLAVERAHREAHRIARRLAELQKPDYGQRSALLAKLAETSGSLLQSLDACGHPRQSH